MHGAIAEDTEDTEENLKNTTAIHDYAMMFLLFLCVLRVLCVEGF